ATKLVDAGALDERTASTTERTDVIQSPVTGSSPISIRLVVGADAVQFVEGPAYPTNCWRDNSVPPGCDIASRISIAPVRASSGALPSTAIPLAASHTASSMYCIARSTMRKYDPWFPTRRSVRFVSTSAIVGPKASGQNRTSRRVSAFVGLSMAFAITESHCAVVRP